MDGYILGVYAEAVRVGTLGYDQAQDAFQFDYDAAWPALPRCRNGPFADLHHVPKRCFHGSAIVVG
jgi:hypothetical protein